jgi:prolyl-tRNA editing enzyme YbaK/EbsC (Cys-tRNA(Pro) deacylase)
MSLESVRAFFAENAPDIDVLVTEESSATICVRAGERVVLVVASGTARLDNRKFKDAFGAKPRMLGAEEVVALTGHPVGGVCPFGLPGPLPVYCDVSLKRFEEVLPAAGATNSALRITPQRLAELTGAEWVDVCQ